MAGDFHNGKSGKGLDWGRVKGNLDLQRRKKEDNREKKVSSIYGVK